MEGSFERKSLEAGTSSAARRPEGGERERAGRRAELGAPGDEAGLVSKLRGSHWRVGSSTQQALPYIHGRPPGLLRGEWLQKEETEEEPVRLPSGRRWGLG